LSRRRVIYSHPRCLYRQRSHGVSDGTCTRFTEGHILVPRLASASLTVRQEGIAPPSLGYRPSTLLLSYRRSD